MIQTPAPFETGDLVQYSTRRTDTGDLAYINLRVTSMEWKQGEWDEYPRWYINGRVGSVSRFFPHKSGDTVTVAASGFRKL
jgi:hypothetical protein